MNLLKILMLFRAAFMQEVSMNFDLMLDMAKKIDSID